MNQENQSSQQSEKKCTSSYLLHSPTTSNIPSSMSSIHLLRYDIMDEGGTTCSTSSTPPMNYLEVQELDEVPRSREQLIHKYRLPKDSVVKLIYDGKNIPWSILPQCSNIEVQIYRPHQTITPNSPSPSSINLSNYFTKERLTSVEKRISSLETYLDSGAMKEKVDGEIESLRKQIEFLTKRMELAESKEWIKNPEQALEASASAPSSS